MTRTSLTLRPAQCVMFIFSPVVFRAGGDQQTRVALPPVLLGPSDSQRPGLPLAVRGWAPLARLEQLSPSLGLSFPFLGQGRGGTDLPSSPGLEGTSQKVLSHEWGPGVQSKEPQPGPGASSVLGVGGGCVGKAHETRRHPGPPSAPCQLVCGGSSGWWYKQGAQRLWPRSSEGKGAWMSWAPIPMLIPPLPPSLAG